MAVVTVPHAAAGPDCGPQLPMRIVSWASALEARTSDAAMKALRLCSSTFPFRQYSSAAADFRTAPNYHIPPSDPLYFRLAEDAVWPEDENEDDGQESE